MAPTRLPLLIPLFLLIACNGSGTMNREAIALASKRSLDEPKPLPQTTESAALPRPGHLIRGATTSRDQFPATFIFYPEEGGKCSGVFVGARAFLTAAHCVGSSGKGTIQLEGTHDLTCTKAPEYNANDRIGASADWALCHTDQEIEDLRRIAFESLHDQPDQLREGVTLLLTGFGCTNDEFQTGSATIASPPGADHFIRMGDGADLCDGDSGGPSYLLLTNSPTGRRRVAGVNARIDSSLASVSTSAAQRFFAEWSVANNAPICGISRNARNCHG